MLPNDFLHLTTHSNYLIAFEKYEKIYKITFYRNCYFNIL